MRIIEILMAGSFRNTDKGDALYYPWGIYGSGYILDTAARKKKILYVSAGLSVLTGIIMLAIYQQFDWTAVWFLLPPYWLCHMFATSKLTSGLQRTDEKLTYRQSLEEVAKKAGFGFLIFMLILSIGMIAMFIWIIAINSYSTTGLLMLMASFASCFLWVTLILKKAKHT